MELERLSRNRLVGGLLVVAALGYAAIPAAATAQSAAHSAAAKTKTKTCGQGGKCTTSLSSTPPPTPVTSPGGPGSGGGGGGGVGGSPAPPPAYSTVNVNVKSRTAGRLQSGSKLIEALDAGHKLVCRGYTRRDTSWFEFMLASKTRMGITYEITDVIHNRTASGVHFCAGLGYRFKTFSGRPARRAKLPDGTLGWVGLLPDCQTDSAGAVTSTGPCVVSIKQSGSPGDIRSTLTVQIPSTSRADPWGGG